MLYVVLIVRDFMYVCVFMYVLWRHISVNTSVFLACEWVYIAVSEHRERAGVDGF